MSINYILIILITINTLSNLYLISLMSKISGNASPEINTQVYEKQLKCYQNLIKVNEKIVKDLLNKTDDNKTNEETETRRY